MWPPSRSRPAAMFDKRSNTYDDSAMHRRLAQRSVARLAIQPRSTVLDAAAGTGLASRVRLADHPGLVSTPLSLARSITVPIEQLTGRRHRGDAERVTSGVQEHFPPPARLRICGPGS